MKEMEVYQPRIVAFFCHWCTYGAADLAGVNRMEYPADFRAVRLPCTGRLNPKFILHAFRQGADGVWVSGCHPGDCHYGTGNLHARRRLELFGNLLEYIGLERDRLHFSWISSAEAEKFQQMATDVVSAVRALGPAKKLSKVAELHAFGLPVSGLARSSGDTAGLHNAVDSTGFGIFASSADASCTKDAARNSSDAGQET